METHRLMSVKEYATEKKVSVQYVYQQIKGGKVGSKKIGGIILVYDDLAK
jgi:hypothetical protein